MFGVWLLGVEDAPSKLDVSSEIRRLGSMFAHTYHVNDLSECETERDIERF